MKVCFVAPTVFGFFYHGAPAQQIGGAELQQKMIGEALSERGVEVSFITHDLKQPDFLKVGALTFIKSFDPEAGVPGVRFYVPRLVRLWDALKKADADIYYARCAGFVPGILALFCAMHRKKFVFAGGSDTDFMKGLELIRFVRDRVLYRFGLKRASAIIVQSEVQKRLLWENYGLRGVLIRNFSREEAGRPASSAGRTVLWVSKIREIKRPLLFVDLAKKFPEESFVMIGGPDGSNPSLYREVEKACAGLPNMEFLGFQPLEKTEEQFDRCSVFVNTSEFEGFPNTFLQAWRRGIPVVSCVDPNGNIDQERLGFTVRNVQEMETALHILLPAREEYTAAIIGYFEENHSVRVIDQYCSLFESVVHEA